MLSRQNITLAAGMKWYMIITLFFTVVLSPVQAHAGDAVGPEEQAHVRSGDGYFSKEMFREAITAYNQALEINPGNADANKKLGLSYLHLGDDNLAFAPLSKALQANPDDTEVIVALGQAYGRKNELSKSIAPYESAVSKEPQNAWFRYLLGEVLTWDQKFDEAILQYKNILEIEPDNDGVRLKLGQVYAYKAKKEKKGEYFNDSLRELERVLKRDPHNVLALKEAGWVCLEKRNIRKARELLEKAYQLDPKDYEIQMSLAQAYSWSRAYAKAISLFTQILTQMPQDTSALYRLGEVYSWRKDYEKSLGYYNEILKKEPGNSGALIGKARVYALQWKFAEADKTFETVLNKEPDNVGALLAKAETERWQWEWKSATSDYKKILRKDKTNKDALEGLKDIDFITSPSIEAIAGMFTDSDKFERRWVGGTLSLKPFEKTQIDFGYLRWIFQQGDNAQEIYREDGSIKIKQHVSSFLDVEAGYMLNRYTNEEGDKEFEQEENVWTSSATVTLRDKANLFLSYNYNAPVSDSILAIENYYSANIVGIGLNWFSLDPLSLQGGYTVSDYSDDNKKVTSEVQLTYRVYDDPNISLRTKYSTLSFDRETDMYWSPSDYRISYFIIAAEKSFWKRSSIGIEGTGAYFFEDKTWGSGVSGFLNFVIKDTLCINVYGSYFNADTKNPWTGNAAGAKIRIVF